MSQVPARPWRVAIVDDDVGFADVVAWVLALEGYEVDVHNDPVNALLGIAERPPDLLLLDYRMPEGRGDELLDALADAGLEPRTIVLTGAPQSEVRVRPPVVGVLHKPVDLEHLLRKLNRMFASERRVASAIRAPEQRLENTGDTAARSTPRTAPS